MEELQGAWSRQALPFPSQLIIQRGGMMMLLAANESEIGMAKGPVQCIFGYGGKGQCNIQSTENPLTWWASHNNGTQRVFWMVRQLVISLGGPT